MDKHPDVESPEVRDAKMTDQNSPLVDETTREYLARWDRLVSSTNWEKGRIISQWREALIEAGAPPGSYADEAWSRRTRREAGGVSPQHAGRLRRVYQRFGRVYPEYAGLHWSHFLAAADWPDAEMWLEGAVQNGWPVAEMHRQRRQIAATPPQKGARHEGVAAELEEDFAPGDGRAVPEVISGSLAVVQEAQPVARHEPEASPRHAGADASRWSDLPGGPPIVEPPRPLESFSPLPPDLNKAFQAFRLAIRRHKRAGWRKISLGEVLLLLDELKQLASAPAEDWGARS